MLKNFNKPIINKREWQSMTQYPYSASAAVCIIAPEDKYCDYALVVGSATTAAIYDYNNDGYELATNPALAGTFGAGTCGAYSPWGIPYITVGGSGNTLTVNSVAFNITGLIIGTTLVITSGTQVGFTTTVTGVLTDGGTGMITIYLKDVLPGTVASGATFKTLSGSYYVVDGGTKVADNFKAFDLGTRNWTVGLNNTALPNLTAEAAMELADEAMDDVPEEVEGEVTKIQTIDILAQVMNKFDTYMNDTELNFSFFINNGRIDKAVNFNTLEDLHTLLNKTFDEKEFVSVKDFNDLYTLMTNLDFCRSLALYGRETYEKPFIAEGLAVLLYEFAVDFTTLLTRYYKDMPTISNEVGEADSFFRKFPSLILNSYITNMIVNSKEFKQLITNEESKALLKDDGSIYNINKKQAAKKPKLFGIVGESLSYFASLIRNDYGDITVGVIDKLAIVAFICSKTAMPMADRLNLIPALIKTVSEKTVDAPVDGVVNTLKQIDLNCTELLRMRADAKITLDADEKQYPMTIR